MYHQTPATASKRTRRTKIAHTWHIHSTSSSIIIMLDGFRLTPGRDCGVVVLWCGYAGTWQYPATQTKSTERHIHYHTGTLVPWLRYLLREYPSTSRQDRRLRAVNRGGGVRCWDLGGLFSSASDSWEHQQFIRRPLHRVQIWGERLCKVWQRIRKRVHGRERYDGRQ